MVAKTVEEYLDEVSYADDGTYVPSQFAIFFAAFIQACNDGALENKSPLLHYKVIDEFDKPNQKKNIINLMHRGLAKTTLVRYLIFFIAVYGGLPNFGHVGLAIYVSDSVENGVKNMRQNLQHQWENSAFLKQALPDTRFTDVRWEFRNEKGQIFVVKGYGAKTGVRGVSELNQRPKLAFLDDLLSDDDARSATVIAAIEDTVHKAIKYALHPKHNKIIWNGTPFHSADPLYKAVESGAWDVNVYPVCERFPCERADFRGSWEDRFDYDYVLNEYETALLQNQVSSFNQELMLRIMSDEDRLIQEQDLRYYDYSMIEHLIPAMNVYVTTDFATSEKQSADFSTGNAWGYNSNGDWFWLNGFCKRQTMDKNINDLFNLVQNYHPLGVGIEVSGQQGGFIPWIKKEMILRKTFFTIASSNNGGKEGLRPTTDKMQRFNVTVPLFKAGKVFFPESLPGNFALQEMLHELRLVSIAGFKSKKDDQLDNISQLPLLNAYTPTQVMPRLLLPGSPYAMSEEPSYSASSSYFV